MKHIWIDDADERETKHVARLLLVCLTVIAASALFWSLVA